MRRLALVGVLVAVAVTLMGASVAWGNSLEVYCSASNGPCDQSGDWQYAAVPVTWEASPVPTQVVGCDSTTYTDVMTTVSCQVWWGSSTTSISFPLNVETSSPTATATPSRPPDSNGWYNHPVTAALSATSFSGIASCTSTTYSGPATTNATVAGTCTDNAGKSVTVTSAPFAYDATPPTLTATATAGDQTAAVSWQTGGDMAPIASIQVTRSGGTKAADVATVYNGDGTGFEDSHLKNGVRYTYAITARDLAGNVATQTVKVTPDARLLGPARNAHVTAPPTLSWTAAPNATYYNVQLFRGRKVLSVWPVNATLQLRRTWRFEGRRYRLKPGRYRWYVWPGLGKRKAGRYGHMIGTGTFVVVR